MRVNHGMGLAASRIGESHHVAVVDVAGDELALINASVVRAEGVQRAGPRFRSYVDRRDVIQGDRFQTGASTRDEGGSSP
jgi:peptide deformylase